MVMALAYRPVRPDDAAALARLGAESFVVKFGALYQPEDLAAYLDEAHSPAAVHAEIASPARLYRLAEDGGALVGYCKLGLVSGFPEHARGARPIELKQLYTAPLRTGQGIGAALLGWALAEARERGFDEMQLSVWSGNVDAQRFYARHGFAKVADVTFRVGAQIDHEFLLARRL
jgi:diamine N-acetyltransferase